MRLSRPGALQQWTAVCCLIAGLTATVPAAAQSVLRPGWGFNGRLRERASCRRIDTAVLPSCSHCREVPNAYRSGSDAQACHLIPKFEYMIFPTEADCLKGLELLKQGSTP